MLFSFVNSPLHRRGYNNDSAEGSAEDQCWASLVKRRRGSNDDTKGWSIGFEVAEKFDSHGG